MVIIGMNFTTLLQASIMVATIARVYHSLPPEEQSKCNIFTCNYGEAGAIDFFGKAYNLPQAISGHNSYYLWGSRNYSGEILIVLGGHMEDLQELFKEVEQADIIKCQYCMPYENNLPIYICRNLKKPVKEIWPQVKHYD